MIRAISGKAVLGECPQTHIAQEREYMLGCADGALANNLVSKTKQNKAKLFQDH